MPTDAELRDQAVAHLKRTTIGYVNKRWVTPPVGSEWAQGMDLLAKIAAASQYPPPPPPAPPPGALALVPVISQGGVYAGTLRGSGSQPVVAIRTAAPVVIDAGSLIANLDTVPYGDVSLIDANYPGAQVTIQHATLNGGNMKAITANDFRSLAVLNCDISKTWGISCSQAQAGASVAIQRNKIRNIDGFGATPHVFQLRESPTIACDVSWNDIQNTFGQSFVNDAINIYRAGGAHVHDNLVYGLYPRALGDAFSGAAIICDIGANYNEFDSNIIIATVNEAVAIEGGHDNKIHDNRGVFSGRDDAGNLFHAANIGMAVYNGTGDPNWGNNQAWNNALGWIKSDGSRNDWWLPGCSGQCSNSALPNPITKATEQAEYQRWLDKVAVNGVSIGA